jgi:hypothetical protein
MTTQVETLGTELVELCRQGKNVEAIDRFYAKDIVSKEATEMPGMPREVRGIDAVRKKNEDWVKGVTVHSSSIHGPFPHGEDRFATYSTYDITSKKDGQRMQMEEVGLYKLKNGKVVEEEFFYSM